MHEIKHRNVMVLGINNNFQQLLHTFPLCEGCVVGKEPQKVPTFLENDFEAKVVFELIHLDMWTHANKVFEWICLLCNIYR
jgi:hypothetical protein